MPVWEFGFCNNLAQLAFGTRTYNFKHTNYSHWRMLCECYGHLYTPNWRMLRSHVYSYLADVTVTCILLTGDCYGHMYTPTWPMLRSHVYSYLADVTVTCILLHGRCYGHMYTPTWPMLRSHVHILLPGRCQGRPGRSWDTW